MVFLTQVYLNWPHRTTNKPFLLHQPKTPCIVAERIVRQAKFRIDSCLRQNQHSEWPKAWIFSEVSYCFSRSHLLGCLWLEFLTQ